MIGTALSHYVIESRLGKGGMGEVYLARDTRLGRLVAIKILPAEVTGSDDRVRRFVNEAKAASALNHPNIVTIHEIDRDGDVPFIVMEHIDGAPLRDRSSNGVAKDEFLDRAIQTANALGAAHAAGIVHRDLKPENIMLTRSGQVKLVDFGLARQSPVAIDADAATAKMDEPVITSPGVIVGTIGYMAPEQVSGLPADARSDVFSLGVVFFEMLTGRPAFRGDSAITTLAAILRDPPPSLKALRPDLPPELVALVERCLEKEPAKRYANGGELHKALCALRAETPAPARRSSRLAVSLAALIAVAAVAGGGLWWSKESKRRWVRDTAIPEIQRLAASDEVFAASQLTRKALEYAPDDAQLKQFMSDLTLPARIESDPPGASIEIASYRSGRAIEWVRLGTTPVEAQLPFRLVKFRVTLDGHETLEVAPELSSPVLRFELNPSGKVPSGMVFVPAGEATFLDTAVPMPAFFIDKYEVTNEEYKKFVDDGGYRRGDLWQRVFAKEPAGVSWEEALGRFVDQTGRPGPAGWQLGAYPEGRGGHPVDGISWYEAAAYAEWVGKSLPTVYHWHRAAQADGVFSDILLASNFAGKGTRARDEASGLGPFGTFDMAGNVKEWCVNAVDDRRYALGGSWSGVTYQYSEPDSEAPMARPEGFGIRLVREIEPAPVGASAPVSRGRIEERRPVDDAAFAIMARIYDYDPAPLNARVDEVRDDHAVWRVEKVSFDAAYGRERVPAYVFVPRNARPPYQAVVYFPSSEAVLLSSSNQLWLRFVEFFVRSGRVVVYPVYKGTYERRVQPVSGPNAVREARVQRTQDVRRTLDYLESRDDIDSGKVLYYGSSFGATNAAFPLAVDRRFAAALLFGGGIHNASVPPEADQTNFLPRVTLPVLLVTGRHDFIFPYESSQVPFFELIGTDPSRKRHAVLEGGHLPADYNAIVREMVDWADRWLGPVETR